MTETSNRFFSYLVPNQLAVGSYPQNAQHLFELKRSGVSAVLSLTEPGEVSLPKDLVNQFVWRQVSIPDGQKGGIPTVEQIEKAVDQLTYWICKKHVVYVHCLAGVGRSPSVCAAYLCRAQGMSLEAAISHIQRLHPKAHPDPHQREVIQTYLDRHQNDVTMPKS